MSVVQIRAALETALNAMSPSVLTAWENVPFTPTPGTAYQRAFIRLARPDNTEISRRHVERGFMQVSLCYPLNTGPGAVEARADLIRATFYRGASFTSGGITVTVINTPEIVTGEIEADRFVCHVTIPLFAPVNG
jgi:hypothetical protein